MPTSTRCFVQLAVLLLLLPGCSGTAATPTAVLLPAVAPDASGVIVVINNARVILRTVDGDQAMSLAPDVVALNSDGHTQPLSQLTPGSRVQLWRNVQTEVILLAEITQPPTPLPATAIPTPFATLAGNSATLGTLPLTTRAGWGAGPVNVSAWAERGSFDANTNTGGYLTYPEPLAAWLNTLIVHHSALPRSDGPFEIQRRHQFERGYADIAYHFVIDAEGVLFEGRLLNVRGTHTGGFNTGTVGVALLGNLSEVEPTAEQLATLVALGRHLADTAGINYLSSHRDFQPGVTECPGDLLHPRLPALAAEMGLTYSTDGYVSPPWGR